MHGLKLEILTPNRPGGLAHRLRRGQQATGDHAADRRRADAKLHRRVRHGEQRRAIHASIENRDVMMVAQACDARLGPRMAGSRPIAEAIENAGDVLIGLGARQLSHDVDNRAIRDIAMLSLPITRDDEPGVLAPLPVDDQDELRLQSFCLAPGLLSRGTGQRDGAEFRGGEAPTLA